MTLLRRVYIRVFLKIVMTIELLCYGFQQFIFESYFGLNSLEIFLIIIFRTSHKFYD